MGTKSDGLDIGNRMKAYEGCSEYMLPHRIPVIIRIDGRAFHTITRRRFKKNWSMEFVEQMKAGVLVEPGNAEEITNAIVYFSENADLGLQMGENGREYVVQHHSWLGVAKKVQCVCEEVV